MAQADEGDQTTLRGRGHELAAASAGIPTLTVIYHPMLERIGQMALLPPTDGQFQVELSRSKPDFFAPGSLKGSPLGDPFVTRNPLVLGGSVDGGAISGQVPDSLDLEVDGREAKASFAIGAGGLEGGTVLTLSGRVVLLLHTSAAPQGRARDLGLVGASDALARLRLDIERVADQNVSVLIRGETGTGKELVARALHDAGPRAGGPFVALNLGAIPASLMSSILFGHAAGAFTGARQSTPGCFARAQRGTLFLDEIAEMPVEAQGVLLRVLEEQTVVPLGAAAAVPIDARVVAATDADLDRRVAEGRFLAPLVHRLAGFTVRVPPLRERREDIGRLLAYFLAREMDATGERARLVRPPDAKPWLAAGVVARMALCEWPGNVRQLANAVRQIVIGSRGADQAQISRELEVLWTPRAPAYVPAPAAAPAPAPARRPRKRAGSISEDALAQALQTARFSTAEAARALGISRTTLYELIERSQTIRKARDLSADQLRSCLGECEGSVPRAAERLGVSDRALKLRLKELGLPSGGAAR